MSMNEEANRNEGTNSVMNQETIQECLRKILIAIGEDPSREGLVGTPHRVAEMYAEVFAGIGQDPLEVLSVGFEEGHEEMVVIKDIPFYSMCEHHLLPFFGSVHIGYIPNGRVVGISKLARVVEIFARRPQLQERLTTQIANSIIEGLKPKGVAVVIEAEHMCMIMRGVEKAGSKVTTSANRGIFRSNSITRSEFFSLVLKGKSS